MKRKIFNLKNLIFLSLILILASFVVGVFSFPALSSFASYELGGSLLVRAKNNGSEVEESSSSTYNGQPIHIYKWKNIKTLCVQYEFDEEHLPPLNELEQEAYNVTFSIQFVKGYLNSSFANPITFNKIFNSYINVDQETASTEQVFDVNQGITKIPSGDTLPYTISQWGIYRFKITINEAERYSDFIFVEPDYITKAPIIDKEVIDSHSSRHNSYRFFLLNSEAYEFVDEESIVWYVKGESKDGIRYALTKNDLSKDGFADISNYLYEDNEIDRTGKTFVFNDKENSGTWTVWCEFKNQSTNQVLKSENAEIIQTADAYNLAAIIWILVIFAIAFFTGGILISVLKNKKEKVW